MKTLLRTEPARLIGGIVAAVAAVVGLLVAFGVPVTDDQKEAILLVVSTVGPLVAGLVIRERVYAPATVKQLVVDAQVDALETRGRRDYAAAVRDRVEGPDHRLDP